uniref:Uncharacterized protein n=1 Tax=Avena sativa TaxID=4498 RepID=A0ACD5WAZ1_AVESA
MNQRTDNQEVTGAKRRQREVSSCERTGKRSEKQKHLYLVLDDWSKGFTIHKIDDDDGDDADLREPGVLRVFTPVTGRCMTFDAIGSNIFITTNPRCGRTPSVIYNTEASGLAVGPPRPEPLLGDSYMSISTADTLYAFQHYITDPQQFLQVMSWAPTDNDDPWAPRPTMDWGWQGVDSPWPFPNNEIIASYSLHPDGHTIFFSAHSKYDNPNPKSIRTFSFDTKHRRWRSHGEWSLPFRDQGHFDTMLDAWVGLNKDGFICSCQVPSRSSSGHQPPDCKMLQERLLCSPPRGGVPATTATLTHVGNDAKFCLVECVLRDGDHAFGRDGCTLHITTFGLKYSHKGELQTMDRVTNSYTVSKHAPLFSPVAFWM